MNRKEFFKKLGFGVIGISVVSKVIAETKPMEVITENKTVTNMKLQGVIRGKDIKMACERCKIINIGTRNNGYWVTISQDDYNFIKEQKMTIRQIRQFLNVREEIFD